jgi:hypothetical protein
LRGLFGLKPSGKLTHYKYDESHPIYPLINSMFLTEYNGTYKKTLNKLDGSIVEGYYYRGEKIDCKNEEEFNRIVKLKAFL